MVEDLIATLSDRGFDTSDQADDVALLLDALGESTAVVIGHDWGADTAYSSATKHPDRVTKMVALGIPHPMTLKPSLSAAWSGRLLRGALSYYKALRPGHPLYRAKIGVPALVVGGAHEPPVLQRGYEATPRRFTAPCEVRILEGAGHWPHRENEEAFLEAVLAFLAD